MNLNEYFNKHNLWDIYTLKTHCEEHKVRVIQSSRVSPSIVMLHYAEEAHFDQAWTEFNRSCRGLIVDLKAKEILAYPFDKFFNVGEQPETQYDALVSLGTFEVSEKLDGSMIILFYDRYQGKVLATTKGSFDSEHGAVATSLIPYRLQNETILQEYTLMFELLDPRFRIVVDYSKKGYRDGLYLIGVRHRPSGRLFSAAEVGQFASVFGLDTFKTYDFRSLDQLLELAKTLPVLDEGFVLKFSNGLLAKVKGTAYLAAHKFISHLSPKSILEALQDGQGSELLKLAPEEYREDVRKLIEEFQAEQQTIEAEVMKLYETAPRATRKEFALWVQESVPADLKPLMFNVLDGKNIDRRKVFAIVGDRKGVSGETKI